MDKLHWLSAARYRSLLSVTHNLSVMALVFQVQTRGELSTHASFLARRKHSKSVNDFPRRNLTRICGTPPLILRARMRRPPALQDEFKTTYVLDTNQGPQPFDTRRSHPRRAASSYPADALSQDALILERTKPLCANLVFVLALHTFCAFFMSLSKG